MLYFQFGKDLLHPSGKLPEEPTPRKHRSAGMEKSLRIIRSKTRPGRILATHVTRKTNSLLNVPSHNGISQTILTAILRLNAHHQLHPILRNASPPRLGPGKLLQHPQKLHRMPLAMIHVKHTVPTPLLQVLLRVASLATSGNHQARQSVFQLFSFAFLAQSHQAMILFDMRFPTLAPYVSHELFQCHFHRPVFKHREIERALIGIPHQIMNFEL